MPEEEWKEKCLAWRAGKCMQFRALASSKSLASAYNFSTGELEIGGSLGLAGLPVYLNWQAPGPVRNPVSKSDVEG